MSYPGYSPYQQGPPTQMPGMPPYPQQPGAYPQQPQAYGQSGSPYPTQGSSPYPQSNAPYPQSNLPYPTQSYQPYPQSGLPTSFGQPAPGPTQYATGFGYNAPSYMPMPQPGGMPPQGHSMGGGPPMGSAPPMGGGPPMGSAPPMGGGPPMGSAPPMGGGPPIGSAPPMGGGHLMGGGPSMGGGPHMGSAPPMGRVPSPMGRAPSPNRVLYPGLSSAPDHISRSTHYGSLGSAPQQGSHHHRPKYSPTVLPAEPFDPRYDAEILRKAMKGFGTDEKAIIQVLANRTNAQRLDIAVQFKTLYGKDLIKDLKSETSGRFEDLLVAMMTPLPQYYAKEIHDALAGVGTDEDVLIEVFCTMSNNELRTIRVAYEHMYNSSLEGDLSGDTSGTFKRLMVSLCTANRDESNNVDNTRVSQDAQALLRAGELRLGTDESTFNAILCQRNHAHLQCVFQEYQRLTGHEFEKAVKNEFSGDAEEGMLAVVRSIHNRAEFFARQLHRSMKGMGTNDRQLIRLIVTRSEVDMGEIKNAYQAKYGEALGDAISSDCSGDYKKCLLALINL